MTGDAGAEPVVHFYFDFISPFGYLASLRIDELAARHGYRTQWHSFLTGVTIMKVMGLPPVPKTPLKSAYAQRDARRYCRRHGIELGRAFGQEPANPLPAGRIFHWLRAHRPDTAKPVARNLFHAYWIEDRDIGDLDVALGCAQAGGADIADLRAALDDGSAAALLREATDDAVAKGVFGSPFFRVGDEPFFGVEKMELLEEWLQQGPW
ncbi:2-hydroxychromene-2-carboxylate isomerase [Maritimibacter sp. UBA3975]|uniref:2-hydroxychromene-2-carboxylate isomerase n=1 Tax=Maritimibacter sp. UBA3975 TaxID=1946833 RepID=UPI000C0937B9|nr:2-hydroxychromene-2-carboxylate isomerase [Maritimibacter sp. UBA3975]MAM63046.1 2-hydroxychromene-2-carboxylate isomerase [Maritimibacter sp.]|tara:strand:+ start:23528 stop:24154 length:627 start_codon:yes stop_codon:yes gene_type:complete